MTELGVEPLTPSIGALVHGINASEPIPAETVRELRKIWLQHQVIFLPNQHLTPAQFKRFGQYFGELDIHPFHRNLGGDLEEVQEIAFDGSRARGTTADQWHIDGTYLEFPTAASILAPIDIPPVGGDTAFASMYAAYDALPESLQRFCDGLDALHAAPFITEADAKGLHPSKRPTAADMAGRVRPVVLVHPETGRKALYVHRMFTKHIIGFSVTESQRFLDMLYEHTTSSLEFQVRHRWRMGDVAIWDNRATLHYGVTDYHVTRVMRRMTIKGSALRGTQPAEKKRPGGGSSIDDPGLSSAQSAV